MRQARMTNSNNNIEELEELLQLSWKARRRKIITPYSEEDDASARLIEAPLGDRSLG